mgnify:CR=1 FL=1
MKVLIDTWWNVNDGDVWNIVDNDKVLIDTWWNVNFNRFSISSVKKSF